MTRGFFNTKELFATKGIFNLYLDKGNVYDQRGFSTSILTKDNQRAFQPWNQTCLRSRGFAISILMKELSATKGLFNLDLDERTVYGQGLFNLDLNERSVCNQGAFQPQSWWKVSKGIFNVETGAVYDQGAFQPQSWRRNCLQPRGFSTFNLDERSVCDLGAFQPWSWWKVIKGLFNPEIGAFYNQGAF